MEVFPSSPLLRNLIMTSAEKGGADLPTFHEDKWLGEAALFFFTRQSPFADFLMRLVEGSLDCPSLFHLLRWKALILFFSLGGLLL